jgi:tetratricopeptide (TPR) repeat protein
MDIDIYQACPCQSGKKIKFCCSRDILPDLNQILALHHGKQFVAALERVGRLIDKHGPRACLLGLQTHLMIYLKEYERAMQVNEQFRQANPRNPLGYQHAALLLAAEGRGADAVDALQNALDACPRNEVPITMANAFRTVGMLLMSQGQLVAGRSHLIFASGLRDGEDEVASQLIMQTFRSPEIPLLLKSEFPLPKADESKPWADGYTNATNFATVGRWRAARLLAEQLNKEYPGQPELLFAIAVWSVFLADAARAEQAWQDFAHLDNVDFDRAVEALAVRFAIDEQSLTDDLPLLEICWGIDDAARFNEAAAASPRLVSGSMLSQHFIDPEKPPPQSGWLLLDRDEVRHVADISDDQFPQVIGELLVYGRQTDREPHVDLYVVRDDHFEDTLASLRQATADLLPEDGDEQVMEQVSRLEHDMHVKWHLPRDMSLDQRREFVNRQRARDYLQTLPCIPFRPLDGRTLQQLASDEAITPWQKKAMAALVLMMEQAADAMSVGAFDFNQLREQLQLPLPGPVDAAQRDFDELSPVEMQRLDFQQLPDEDLIKAYVMASSCGNFRVLRSTGPVILERPRLEEYITFEVVYVMLARLTADTDKALELMQKARKHAAAADRPIGGLLIDELELRLERNRPEGCQELLQVLQASHLKDPRNQYRLAAVLQRFGIIGPDGRMRGEPVPPEEPVPAADSGSRLWTPGDPAAATAESEGKSGLWLPE